MPATRHFGPCARLACGHSVGTHRPSRTACTIPGCDCWEWLDPDAPSLSGGDPGADDDPAQPVTILDVARARGVAEINGTIAASEFERVGLAIMGGCQHCGATLAAYNAYPSRTGYWLCADAIDEAPAIGFASVADFERYTDEPWLDPLDVLAGAAESGPVVWQAGQIAAGAGEPWTDDDTAELAAALRDAEHRRRERWSEAIAGGRVISNGLAGLVYGWRGTRPGLPPDGPDGYFPGLSRALAERLLWHDPDDAGDVAECAAAWRAVFVKYVDPAGGWR